MGYSGRIQPQVSEKVCAGVLSVLIHVALLVAMIAPGSPDDGQDAQSGPSSTLALIHTPDADEKAKRLELPTTAHAVAIADFVERLQSSTVEPSTLSLDVDSETAEQATPAPPEILTTTPEIQPEIEPEIEAPRAIETPAPEPPRIEMSLDERTMLVKRLENLAEKMAAMPLDGAEPRFTWEHDGRRYSAVLLRQRAEDGTALERVVAEVSTSDQGKRLATRLTLNRLAFSQFTQLVDRWDPMVQLHDDEIIGRFHSNTQLNLLYDAHVAPKFLGKVTTAARGFNTEARGRRRDTEVFQGGVETRVNRIRLPNELAPFEWAELDEDALVHEIASDARIIFLASGGYTWRTWDSGRTEYADRPAARTTYLIAAPGVALHVRGTVAGRVLVYSPERILIEGDLKYANDPRTTRDSPDYLGLVSDGDVVIARPGVTGPGDLEIDAAIFARRRFLVTHIEHPRTATLKIFGSLTAGTLSASEPRYATRIEYDARFEKRRPPGFPSTNRFEADDEWDGKWVEVAESVADETP